MRKIYILMYDDGLNGRLPVAMEASPGRRNKLGETYEQFEVRMAYHEAVLPPRHPVPAIPNHLNLIAAEPLQPWEDFKAIGHHGRKT